MLSLTFNLPKTSRALHFAYVLIESLSSKLNLTGTTMDKIVEKMAEEVRPFEDLKRRVEMTRDARFQANLRLERRLRRSNWMISILSLFVIFLSLVPNFTELSQSQSQILLSLSIVNSIFIIITSLLEAAGSYQTKGEALHRSARKIATVYNKLMLLVPDEKRDAAKIRDLQQEYQAALDDCAFNHENIDHYCAVANKPVLSRRYNPFWTHHAVYPIRYFVWENVWMTLHIVVLLVSAAVIWSLVFPIDQELVLENQPVFSSLQGS